MNLQKNGMNGQERKEWEALCRQYNVDSLYEYHSRLPGRTGVSDSLCRTARTSYGGGGRNAV
ncbi:hypothetical protein NXW38_13630 [Bacteroides ovatus]|nr:hypothetical protein [Bacteroides ovatus]MCS3100767.1 hypothetical protein [Bacteroides ovatus]